MSLKKNIVANYLGQGWTAVMQLAFVPLYIQYLGMEAYGLIGIYTVLQAGFSLLDIGMTPTLNREMARFTAGSHTPQSIRELLQSLEKICVSLAFLIAISVWAASDWFAQHWLRVEQLPLDTVRNAIAIIGLVVALRFVESIYRGAILGLQTHVWLNAVTATLSTARWLGVVGILAFVSPTIGAFFLWQGCVSFVTVVVFAVRVHNVLPAATSPVHFSKEALFDVWSFARGMIATTFLSLILTQTDKILLSRLLSLEAFGAYTLAAAVANALLLIVTPLVQSYSPRFTELLTRHDEQGLISAYHQGSQLMTVMVVPAALILIFHGETVLSLWTGNADLARNVAPLLALLAMGTTFLALMNIPYMLQLAYGWSMFAAKVNAVLVAVLIPVLFWAIPRYGAMGAAWAWVTITSSYIFLMIPIMHIRLLPKEKKSWYWQDTAIPTGVAAAVAYAGGFIHPVGRSPLLQLAWLLAIGMASLIAALFSIPTFQKILLRYFREKSFAVTSDEK